MASFWVTFCSSCLGFPNPGHLDICPKVSTESQAGVWQIWRGLGRHSAALQMQCETDWSLRKHWEESASSTLPLYPDEFMKTHDVLSIHSIEVFPENMNYNLDPWALPGLTHFLQNTSRRNLSFPTTKTVEACKVYEIPELSRNWVVSQQHHFGFRQYILSKACWKGVNPFIGF